MGKQVLGSLLVGVLVGLAVGLYLGWKSFPVEYTNYSLNSMAPRYQDEYTVMVAEGYQVDRDLSKVVLRLQPLEKDNIPDYVKELTVRYISQSNVPAIPPMVALSEAMGVTSPVMDIYRSTPVNNQ